MERTSKLGWILFGLVVVGLIVIGVAQAGTYGAYTYVNKIFSEDSSIEFDVKNGTYNQDMNYTDHNVTGVRRFESIESVSSQLNVTDTHHHYNSTAGCDLFKRNESGSYWYDGNCNLKKHEWCNTTACYTETY